MPRPCMPFALAAGSILAASSACTPTLEFLQCRDDTDCTNAAGRDLVCSAEHECIERSTPEALTCTRGSECRLVFGDDHVCGSSGTCVALDTEACHVSPSGTDPDGTVYLGSILATSAHDPSAATVERGVQLAIEEFSDVAALPDGRDVAWIACDSGGKRDTAVEAARHLIEVGVPAIVGPSRSEEVLAVAAVTTPARTFLVTPTATTPALTGLSDDGLVWRTIDSDVLEAAALADRLAALEPPPARVLVLAKDDTYGRELRGDVNARLAGTLPDLAIATLFYPDPDRDGNDDALQGRYRAVVEMGFPHRADTVLLLGTAEVHELAIHYLVVRDAQSDRPPLPRFVFSHGGVDIMDPLVRMVAEGFRPTLMAKLEAVAPRSEDADNSPPFSMRYAIRYAEQERRTIATLGYDATMVALFGLVDAAARGQIDGVQVARAMPRLCDRNGTRIDFGDGLDFIVDGVAALAAGRTVDLEGVSGDLDFDLVSGDVRTELLGWGVVPREGQGGEPVLTPLRHYVLDDAPAVAGEWVELEDE